MKKIFSCIVLAVCSTGMNAQNVGINTPNPQASLDVRGSHRVGGINNYMKYDSATGRIEWVGAALFAPVSQQIIRHSASSEGLYAGGGKLQYMNSVGNPVFFSDWSTGNGYFSGRLGIGTMTPFCPLTFASSLGEKISLYGGSSPNYGFGVQPYTFQMHVDGPGSDIAFGSGSSDSFSEVMRIKGNGNVGIGNDPAFRLDVSGRMRIRSGGTNATSAGIALNSLANDQIVGFIGLQTDDLVGLVGKTPDVNFGINFAGGLVLNGSPGSVGQVIQSTGGGVCHWVNQTNTLYSNTYSLTNTTPSNLSAFTLTPIPGMTVSYTLDDKAKLFVSYSIPVQTISCVACGNSTITIAVYVDGTESGLILTDVGNGMHANMTYSKVYTLNAGSHSIYLAASVNGASATFGPLEKVMNIQFIPR